MRLSLFPLALVALLAAPAASALTAAAPEPAWDGSECWLMYEIADWQRTYLCVNVKDAKCAVYTYHVRGSGTSRSCIVGAPGVATGPGDVEACIPTNGGNMDYHSYVCVDTGRTSCPVWTEDWTGSRCLGRVPR